MNALTVCLLVALAVGVAQGLQCYTCNSTEVFGDEGSCGDTYDAPAGHLKTCATDEKFCRKEKTGVKTVYNTVNRGCAEMCEEQNVADLDAHRVFCCKEDKCNAASAPVVATFLVLGAAFVARLF